MELGGEKHGEETKGKGKKTAIIPSGAISEAEWKRMEDIENRFELTPIWFGGRYKLGKEEKRKKKRKGRTRESLESEILYPAASSSTPVDD